MKNTNFPKTLSFGVGKKEWNGMKSIQGVGYGGARQNNQSNSGAEAEDQ